MPAKKTIKRQPTKVEPINYFSQISRPVIANFENHKKAWFISLITVGLLLILVVPHLFIALVDYRPISIFEYYSTLDKKYGSQVKDEIISEKLVESEAQKRGISVTDADVNTEYSKYETQASGSANLAQVLSQQGLTTDEFRTQIKLQLLVQKMFTASVSASEVDQYIQTNSSQLPSPVTDTVRQSITDQLMQQKVLNAFQAWLDQAKSSNRVIHL